MNVGVPIPARCNAFNFCNHAQGGWVTHAHGALASVDADTILIDIIFYAFVRFAAVARLKRGKAMVSNFIQTAQGFQVLQLAPRTWHIFAMG